MALLGQGKTAEAVVALRRAVSVLPERSLYWRTAQWRLGTALAASGGQERDALAAYIKSYNRDAPDAARRAVIESLYTKVNGSPAGLDAQIGPAPARLATLEAASAGPAATPAPVATPAPAVNTPAVNAKPEPSPSSAAGVSVATATPESSPATTPATPLPSPAPESAVAIPSPAASTEPAAAATPTPALPVEPSPTPAQTKSTAEATAAAGKDARGDAKRSGASRNASCALSLGASSLELTNSGGSASVVVTLEGNSNLAGINAATANWSDIIILREPQGSSDANSLKFTVTSISKTTGTFKVIFKSPCGTQELAVTVK
jgi:hypothetical protein